VTRHPPHLSALAASQIKSAIAAIVIYPPTAIQTIPAAATRAQMHYRASLGNIVHEASTPTVRGINSFDAFVSTNSGVIGTLLDDYRQQYRYVLKQLVDKR